MNSLTKLTTAIEECDLLSPQKKTALIKNVQGYVYRKAWDHVAEEMRQEGKGYISSSNHDEHTRRVDERLKSLGFVRAT